MYVCKRTTSPANDTTDRHTKCFANRPSKEKGRSEAVFDARLFEAALSVARPLLHNRYILWANDPAHKTPIHNAQFYIF